MAKGYCCFDSMMARIIQEQGRPQLTAFGPTGSWGTPDQPNCRGFTPEEFEAIDFAGIDFSEYISVIQQNLSTKIQDAQTTIGTTIQNRVNQITK
jgi:conjugal transfer mating pair stabilization protein TraN